MSDFRFTEEGKEIQFREEGREREGEGGLQRNYWLKFHGMWHAGKTTYTHTHHIFLYPLLALG